MRPDAEGPNQRGAPNVRGRSSWWYYAILLILLAVGVIAAVMFFVNREDEGIVFGFAALLGAAHCHTGAC